jgi:hypothetical protein
MKTYLVLILLGVMNTSKGQTMATCYTEENFERAYHYVQWKKHTSEKLGENHKILLDDGYDVVALEQDGESKIVFSKKEYRYFFVSHKNGVTPLTKSASDLKKYEERFCQLVELANREGLPKNYTYTYSDGSANEWVVTDKTITYIPVTKETSSSGLYDGGTPFQKEITETQYNEIKLLLKKGLQNPSIQTDKRTKGTSVIDEGITATAIIASKIMTINSFEKTAIETWLNAQKENSLPCRFIYKIDVAVKSKRPDKNGLPLWKYAVIYTCKESDEIEVQRQVLSVSFGKTTHHRELVKVEKVFDTKEDAAGYAKENKILMIYADEDK